MSKKNPDALTKQDLVNLLNKKIGLTHMAALESVNAVLDAIADALSNLVDLRPAAVIRKFDLCRPIYSPFAAYGHMGREDLSAPWEECDLVPALLGALGK